jgi:hypothetical protein
MDETPEQRIARWVERDRVVGLVAEVEQLEAQLAERDRDLTNMRERCQQLGLRVAGLEVERNRLSALVTVPPAPSFGRRVYRRLRRAGVHAVRRR